VIGTAEAADEKPAEVDLIDIKSEAGLFAAVEQLFKLGSANDVAVRSAFAISTQATTGSSIELTRLWRSLIDAEKLSGRIQKELAGIH
jgi:hypothetical protein